MSETDKDLQKAIDEHLKRLYERYKSNAKVFTATHIGHISLSIVFVLSILFPFLYLQIDARETNSELERLSQSIAQQDYVKYILYYLLSAGLFFFGFQRIRGAIKNYGASSSATEL